MTPSPKLTAARAAQWQWPEQPCVTLHLPFPPSVNHIWKHGAKGKGYRSPRYVSWANIAGLELNAQKPGCITGDYRIRLTLGRPDRRRRDQENFIKAVSDLLVEHGVIEDDSLAVVTTIAWSDRIEGCRVTLKAVSPLAKRRAA